MMKRGFLAALLFTLMLQASTEATFKDYLTKHQKLMPFKSSFKQIKSVKEMGIELSSEGVLEVKSLSEATWQINKPGYLRVEISSAELRMYSDPKSAPRVIKKSSSTTGDGSWLNLLMDKPEEVLKHFQISEIAPKKFKLVPNDSKQGFEFMELEFLQNAKIKELFIQENKDDSIKITFDGKTK